MPKLNDHQLQEVAKIVHREGDLVLRSALEELYLFPYVKDRAFGAEAELYKARLETIALVTLRIMMQAGDFLRQTPDHQTYDTMTEYDSDLLKRTTDKLVKKATDQAFRDLEYPHFLGKYAESKAKETLSEIEQADLAVRMRFYIEFCAKLSTIYRSIFVSSFENVQLTDDQTKEDLQNGIKTVAINDFVKRSDISALRAIGHKPPQGLAERELERRSAAAAPQEQQEGGRRTGFCQMVMNSFCRRNTAHLE